MPPRANWTEAAERRRLIIEAAMKIFSSKSYGTATTADVARVAEVSQATIFKHFATKRDLFLATLARTTDLVLERWQAAAMAEPTPLDGLVAIAHTYALMAGTEHMTFRVRIRAVAESDDPVIQEGARASYVTIVGFLRDLIEKAKAADQLPESLDSMAAAWYFLSMGQGFNLNHYMGFGWNRAFLGELVATMFRGMTCDANVVRPMPPLPAHGGND